MKTTITAKQLTGIKGVESALARRETDEVLKDLPPGHPLLADAEAERQKGADISDLPESHPLKVAMKEAKDRLLAQQGAEAKEQDRLKVRKAKRLQDSKQRQDQIATEEREREIKRDTYRAINEKIDRALDSVEGLLTVVGSATQETFGEDRFSMVKVARLQRLMFAARRGLSDSRLKASGV